MLRIENIHSESRRVEPVDRQTRQEQREKDEERSRREELEEAYILNLTLGRVRKSSPFIPGAYTRMGAVQQAPKVTPAAAKTEIKAEIKAEIELDRSHSGPVDKSDTRPRLDTYS